MNFLLDTKAVSAWLDHPRYVAMGKVVPVEMARVYRASLNWTWSRFPS
jgi:hypothetical protein